MKGSCQWGCISVRKSALIIRFPSMGDDADAFIIKLLEFGDMEGGSSLFPRGNSKASEMEMLQRQHEEKTMKIQELKRQIESVKLRLEKRKKEIPEEKMEAFKILIEKYNSMRDEYNALLAEKLGKNE